MAFERLICTIVTAACLASIAACALTIGLSLAIGAIP